MSQVCNRLITVLKLMHDLVIKVPQFLVLVVLLVIAEIVQEKTTIRAGCLKR